MWNEPTQGKLDLIPKLYQTEHISLPDKTIHAHFFLGSCDWYICEYDGDDLLWGFACLNGDLFNAEFGLISYAEQKGININNVYQVEYDEYWTPKPASQIQLIAKAQGWSVKSYNTTLLKENRL